jgi:hypothetical protein
MRARGAPTSRPAPTFIAAALVRASLVTIIATPFTIIAAVTTLASFVIIAAVSVIAPQSSGARAASPSVVI